jgi:D-hexose-6-phosphate mutarotase
MQFFVRLLGGAAFSLMVAMSATQSASASINVGATLVEYDKNLTPLLWLSEERTILRNLPVRY